MSPFTALRPFVGPWPFFSFLILYTVGRTPWMGDQPVARPLPTHRTQTQNKRTPYRHPCLEWDSNATISAFEGAKAVHALDCATTVSGVQENINTANEILLIILNFGGGGSREIEITTCLGIPMVSILQYSTAKHA
jgi:hypothetical protein